MERQQARSAGGQNYWSTSNMGEPVDAIGPVLVDVIDVVDTLPRPGAPDGTGERHPARPYETLSLVP
jgi:hypothetical protein